MPILSNKLKGKTLKIAEQEPLRKGSLWAGPSAEGLLGGITFSMLSSFLVCRERFRLKYVEGLRPAPRFSHALEYGNMWHTCEEAHAGGIEWGVPLKAYAQKLLVKYPLQRAEVEKWYKVCCAQFPIYADYWSKHKDVVQRTPILQERVFDVHYDLPSGRWVRLRGKFDAVDFIGKGKTAGIYLFENKTKGDIDQEQLQRQLSFDIQTQLYLTVLTHDTGIDDLEAIKGWNGQKLTIPIRGVRYNVVRRPLSGGKGTIKQKEGSKNVKPETEDEFYARLQQYFIDEPEHFFMRWTAEVSPRDIEQFKVRCLNPVLEQLCVWYEHITCPTGRANPFDSAFGYHWQHPYGILNSINEGYDSDTDNLLATGSEVGLVRTNKLFEELQ